MLDLHVGSVHRFPCTFCDMVLDNETDRDQHAIRVHLLRCEVCGLRLDSAKMKEEHLIVAHRFACDFCEKVCSSVPELQLHCVNMHEKEYVDEDWVDVKDEDGGDGGYVVCSECTESFATEMALVHHYREEHVRKCVEEEL